VNADDLVGSFGEMILQARDPAVLWPSMLQELQHAIGFDSGYIAASWGTALEGRGAIAVHNEPFMKRNLGRLLAEISPREISLYTDCARNHEDVWPAYRRKELAVFNEVLDPCGVKHMLVRVSVRSGNVAGFNLERCGVSSRFSERQLSIVNAVAPLLHVVEILTLEEQDTDSLQDFAEAHGLTHREMEFVELAVRGLQNGEIAMLKTVSIHTVRNTLARVFEKAGVTTRAELTYAATSYAAEKREREIRPPASNRPDDGLKLFMQRVHEASRRKEAKLEPPRSMSQIVYTPPVPL
jgi:DNA-binding CsgD family transcriptional regulator